MTGWMATKTISSGARNVRSTLRLASTIASRNAQTKAGRPVIGW